MTGIMLVITMLLALELLERTDASPPLATAKINEDLKETIETAEREIQRLESHLDARAKLLSSASRVSVTELRQQISDTENVSRRLRELIRELRRRESQTQVRVQETQQQQTESENKQATLLALEGKRQQLRQQLRKLQKSNRLIFNPVSGNSKTPWLVEIDNAALVVAESGVSRKPQAFSDVKALIKWTRQRNKRTDYFVLLLKPNGIETFREVRDLLEEQGFDIGFDLLSPHQTVIDPETGAGTGK
ncbi:MAG: hypothetical protein VYE64_09840 [Planctomycetota bacterium]|nr:hypothetical protein [Planctomycetota bacterium]